ncbi:MAG: putative toxin-antitoxin system toxin component, PIN family [Candidatus Poribacteria bacterium]|nr:putative toxin-antitoxin system toxin component, PIN family [Candidatus Poribacteria bacterium]
MKPIAVYDTNILLSGLGWKGAPYRCIELARQGKVEGLTCSEILNELMEKLATKLKFSQPQVTDTVADLLSFLRLVQIANTLKIVETDADDDKIIECAVVGSATHIVTGDCRHLLPLKSYQGILFVAAADFFAQFQ